MTDTTDYPSRRAGLRDELVKALGRITTVPPVAHRRAQADHVLGVLYREWPWLRAEAEDAAAVSVPAADRAAVLREAVRRIEDGELLPDRDLRFRRGADWVLDALRRLAAEAAVPAVGVAADTTPAESGPDFAGTCPCGHDDYHDGHEWADRPGVWCPGIGYVEEPGPVVPAQPGNDTPVVAYRSHSGSLLRCLTHAPDQTGLNRGAFHPVTAGDLPDGGICTYRAPGVECGADVLNPQKP